ncbi:45672_t:CDS:2 [Gigaspora margarita]|uniref:45672_t:CDS:1 n=1 Tax=Gigaspora margarita TaxID=4874 RepID=A0ABN7V9V2_GIGMA|nr:45672_t:CDS:2 [Gigaspora margarita]
MPDCHKAFDKYKEASKNFYYINSFKQAGQFYFKLLKEIQLIGLIYLGLCYKYGMRIAIDKPKALQSFLQSIIKGSNLGKFYVEECYYYGHGVITSDAPNHLIAEGGNGLGQSSLGNCYYFGMELIEMKERLLNIIAGET